MTLPKPPNDVLVMLDWAGVERRYFFSANRAADGLLAYYHPKQQSRSPTRALVYRLDKDASAALDALIDREATALYVQQAAQPSFAPSIWSDKKRWKVLKDKVAGKIAAIVSDLP